MAPFFIQSLQYLIGLWSPCNWQPTGFRLLQAAFSSSQYSYSSKSHNVFSLLSSWTSLHLHPLGNTPFAVPYSKLLYTSSLPASASKVWQVDIKSRRVITEQEVGFPIRAPIRATLLSKTYLVSYCQRIFSERYMPVWLFHDRNATCLRANPSTRAARAATVAAVSIQERFKALFCSEFWAIRPFLLPSFLRCTTASSLTLAIFLFRWVLFMIRASSISFSWHTRSLSGRSNPPLLWCDHACQQNCPLYENLRHTLGFSPCDQIEI